MPRAIRRRFTQVQISVSIASPVIKRVHLQSLKINCGKSFNLMIILKEVKIVTRYLLDFICRAMTSNKLYLHSIHMVSPPHHNPSVVWYSGFNFIFHEHKTK
uniref:Uncharacterized protein n=1 Tax=Opuntia streptacantha TaxID=393608 RepID=A0A7C8YSZ9_OPUST